MIVELPSLRPWIVASIQCRCDAWDIMKLGSRSIFDRAVSKYSRSTSLEACSSSIAARWERPLVLPAIPTLRQRRAAACSRPALSLP